MSLKEKINGIIRDIEAINVEPKDVGYDDEDYQAALRCLGEAADELYGVVYYLEKGE